MSAIYFHAEDGEARLRGSERAYAGCLCNDLFVAALGLSRYIGPEDAGRFLTLFPADHYLHGITYKDTAHLVSHIRTALAVGGEFFTPILNTALVMGSDAVKLLARLHGQCELHAYVEGVDRAWLADLIERGRAAGVLREAMGWEDAATLLRSKEDAPVVTSYSVTDSFPNPYVAGWTDDRDGDGWYDLPANEQWNRAIAGLRAAGAGLRLARDDWETFYFGDGATAFQMLHPTAAGGGP